MPITYILKSVSPKKVELPSILCLGEFGVAAVFVSHKFADNNPSAGSQVYKSFCWVSI